MNIKKIISDDTYSSLDIRCYDEETLLFHEDEKCEVVCYVIKGEVNIISYSNNGEENLISRIVEDEFFANALVFSKSPYYLGEVVVRKGTTLIIIPKEKLLDMLKCEEFLEYYLRQMSEKTIYMSSRNKLLAIKNIRARIIYYLELNKGKVHMSVTELSKELVLPRPSVSRELSNMIDEGIIIKKGRNIYLNY